MKASARLQSLPRPAQGLPKHSVWRVAHSRPPRELGQAPRGAYPTLRNTPTRVPEVEQPGGRCTERMLLASGDRAHHACARARGDGTATRSLGVAAILFRASRRRLWAVPGESALGLCGLLVPGRVASRVASFLPVPGVALAALSPGARGQVSPPGSPPPPGGPRCHPVMAAGAGHGGH